MLEIAEVEELRGRHVVGSDGNKIGKIDEIYLDEESGRPEWALVNTGLFGLKSSFVLITGAEADGDQLTVPFDKATVKDAPNIDPEGALSPEEEEILFAHYGRTDYAGAVPATAGAPQAAAPAATGDPAEDPAADTTQVAGPSASLAEARIAREDESGLGGAVADSDGTGGERTLEELQELRRGPEGETGRSDTEDPVPPDGGPPPRQDHEAEPPAATIGQDEEHPRGAGEQTTGDAASDPRSEHWEDEALAERGNATATPESGPAHVPSEHDALEAPETGDASAPAGGGTSSGRARLRKYVAPGSAEAEGPGAPDPKQGVQ